MEPHGYYPVPFTPGFWGHKNRKTKFCLCLDEFGVKHFSKDDADQLLEYLKNKYAISADWGVFNYLGLTIYWNYNKEYVDIFMPEYVEKLLNKLQHPKPKRTQYASHLWTLPAYGKRFQMAPESDESNLFDKKITKGIQSVVGTLLYYSRSVDPIMLQAINEISQVQSKSMSDTK